MRKPAIWQMMLVIVASGCGRESGMAPATDKEISFDLGGGVRLELVQIPAGEFRMGSPDSDKYANSDEKPQHRVRITKPFYLGKYPVTQEQWEAVMGSNPSQFKGPKNPVERVSWDDCQHFLEKLNAKLADHRKFRLPTEAQWEYACRAGSTACYCFGDKASRLSEYAWYNQNSGNKSHPVGEKKPNAWGLYDMYGNVWQWCADRYDGGYYSLSPTDDPLGPCEGNARRVFRGGSWEHGTGHCRSAYRGSHAPGRQIDHLGFRVLILVDSQGE
jgi:formylglycine-generating enzyme required for sulfatase activity